MDAPNGLPYWLALRRAGLGSTNFMLLLKHFGAIDEAWEAPSDELRKAGLEAQYIRGVVKARATFDPGREAEQLEKHAVRAYTWLDAEYPALLYAARKTGRAQQALERIFLP